MSNPMAKFRLSHIVEHLLEEGEIPTAYSSTRETIPEQVVSKKDHHYAGPVLPGPCRTESIPECVLPSSGSNSETDTDIETEQYPTSLNLSIKVQTMSTPRTTAPKSKAMFIIRTKAQLSPSVQLPHPGARPLIINQRIIVLGQSDVPPEKAISRSRKTLAAKRRIERKVDSKTGKPPRPKNHEKVVKAVQQSILNSPRKNRDLRRSNSRVAEGHSLDPIPFSLD